MCEIMISNHFTTKNDLIIIYRLFYGFGVVLAKAGKCIL